MTAQSTVLAVRLRQAQWLLDDLAFDAGADRLDAQQIAEAIAVLAGLGTLLASIHTTICGEVPGEVSVETAALDRSVSESRR
ncbi:hypothetical protein E1181_19255 [Saccharopolyspora terrae]|uniref:Uncharacterized protein n=1 Tax=Saccharopolyspora terrae TaxID=2530384 RepID=A0A4R4VE96_9PSEU|nr:hypothetical protein [Saccharopolyspora terrae]TDD03868.1 hypothetical protein E1181_19255 [Saccharopolyspora terrae]